TRSTVDERGGPRRDGGPRLSGFLEVQRREGGGQFHRSLPSIDSAADGGGPPAVFCGRRPGPVNFFWLDFWCRDHFRGGLSYFVAAPSNSVRVFDRGRVRYHSPQ